MTRLACALCALYLSVFVWLAWWTATTAPHAPAWFTAGNAAAAIVLVIAVIQQLDNLDLRRELAERLHLEAERVADAEHQAATEADAACCEHWWTSCGTSHDDTCPHRTPRSSTA